MKFLGMEISEHDKGFLTSQAAYIEDKTSSREVKKSKIPTVKDMYPPPEDPVDERDVRLAQKEIGELLWISTRTRPELAFVVSRCGAMVLTAPKWVQQMADLVWGYLKHTQYQGLWYIRDHGSDEAGVELYGGGGLRAYSDISFAPTGDGSVSHGAVFVMWRGSLLWWRSGKQPFPTLSTAEAELVEAIEAFMLGDSVDAVVAEHERGYVKSLYIDNQAAVALLGEGPTTWRTRHLKVRAAALRWRLTRLDWRAVFIPGAYQIADLGTKALSHQRMDDLKQLLGMGLAPEADMDLNDAQDISKNPKDLKEAQDISKNSKDGNSSRDTLAKAKVMKSSRDISEDSKGEKSSLDISEDTKDISENAKDENIALNDPENQEVKSLKKLEKLKMALWVGALASGIDGAEATGSEVVELTCSPSARAWKALLTAFTVVLMALTIGCLVKKIMVVVNYIGVKNEVIYDGGMLKWAKTYGVSWSLSYFADRIEKLGNYTVDKFEEIFGGRRLTATLGLILMSGIRPCQALGGDEEEHGTTS